MPPLPAKNAAIHAMPWDELQYGAESPRGFTLGHINQDGSNNCNFAMHCLLLT
jgi:hypothetical protein